MVFAQRLADQSYGAIALGDSIMAGWQLKLLQAAFDRPTLNISFGGDGTQDVLWRLETLDWSRQDPQYVILLIGTNDIRRPACAIAQGVLAVVRKVHTIFPSATVIVTSILPRGVELREHDFTIIEVNRQLATAAPHARFRFFDVHDAFLCDHHTPCRLFGPGNLHLTAPGYQLLTDRLRRLLQAG